MLARFVLIPSTLLFVGALAAGAGADDRVGTMVAALNAADYLLYADFADADDLDLFGVSNSGNDTARIVNGSVAIDLDRYEDEVPYRTELVTKPPAQAFDNGKFAHIGEQYWYGIRIFVPTTWVPDNSYEVVTQWHGARSKAGVSLRMDHPGVSAGVHPGRTEIADRWLLMVTGMPFDLGPIETSVGKWVDWVFRIRWSPSDGGRITVWRNKRWVADVRRPTMVPDEYGPYWKFGIYKSPWKQVPELVPIQSHRTLLFDNVRIGQGAGIAIDSF